MKFTPGPWVVEKDNGYLINGVIQVPDCYEEHHADAALIAAAPELYEALKEAKEIIRIMHGDLAWGIYDQHSPEMKRINNALAKAEGRK